MCRRRAGLTVAHTKRATKLIVHTNWNVKYIESGKEFQIESRMRLENSLDIEAQVRDLEPRFLDKVES